MIFLNEKIDLIAIEMFLDDLKDINQKDEDGATCLHYLCENEEIKIELLQYLLEKSSDPNLQNRKFNKPIELLCSNKNINLEMIDLILNFGSTLPSSCLSLLLKNHSSYNGIISFFIEKKAIEREELEICLINSFQTSQIEQVIVLLSRASYCPKFISFIITFGYNSDTILTDYVYK